MSRETCASKLARTRGMRLCVVWCLASLLPDRASLPLCVSLSLSLSPSLSSLPLPLFPCAYLCMCRVRMYSHTHVDTWIFTLLCFYM